MRLSHEAVQEFKAICLDEFGIALSDADAEQRAVEVLEFFWFLYDDEAAKRPDSELDSFDSSELNDLR